MAKRESFSEAFSPYLQNTATMISRMLIADKEREKDNLDWQTREDYKKKTEAEQLQTQSEALAKYRAGGETELTGVPDIFGIKPNKSNLNLDVNIPNQGTNIAIPETKTRFRNYSPQERMKIGLTGGLTPFQVNQDQEPPKPQDIYEGYIEKPYQRVARNKYTGQVETIEDYGDKINPAYKFNWKQREIPDSLYKGKDGRFYKREGMFDYDANKWNENEKGEKVISKEIRIPLTKTSTNGEKLFSKEINENFNQYKKSTNDLLVKINSGIDPDTGIQATPTQIKQWKSELGQTTENYSNLVKNTGSTRFRKFVNDLYNGTEGGKKPKTNAVPLVYWNKMLNEGSKYGFTPKDYQSGYQLFLSTYKADPLELYGLSGFDEYFENDNSDNTNEEEE